MGGRRTDEIRGNEINFDDREEANPRSGSNGRKRDGGGKFSPGVIVTGDAALPDDISPHNYLSVRRDSAKRLPVLMPTDIVPIMS